VINGKKKWASTNQGEQRNADRKMQRGGNPSGMKLKVCGGKGHWNQPEKTKGNSMGWGNCKRRTGKEKIPENSKRNEALGKLGSRSLPIPGQPDQPVFVFTTNSGGATQHGGREGFSESFWRQKEKKGGQKKCNKACEKKSKRRGVKTSLCDQEG